MFRTISAAAPPSAKMMIKMLFRFRGKSGEAKDPEQEEPEEEDEELCRLIPGRGPNNTNQKERGGLVFETCIFGRGGVSADRFSLHHHVATLCISPRSSRKRVILCSHNAFAYT